MNFQDALTEMQNGNRVTRASWKDKTKYCFIYQTDIKMLQDMVGYLYRNEKCQVAHYTHTSARWTPIESGILATDWELAK